MIATLYRWLTTVGAPLIRRHLDRRLARGKEDPSRINERFGIAPVPRPAGKLIWIHAASVGETMSALSLIGRLASTGAAVLLTTGTRTSATLAATRLPTGAFHQYVPLDVPPWVDAFFDHWQPDIGLIIEAELWPNLILTAKARGIRLALVNGRMSERAWRGWTYARPLIQGLLRAFDVRLAQDELSAWRLGDLAQAPVLNPGNLKYDAPDLPDDAQARGILLEQIAGRTVILAASTHQGEEALVAELHTQLRQHYADLLTIIAPRHPERGSVVADELSARGLTCARRQLGQSISAAGDIYIADTLGELGIFYRVSPIVFMGGSLIPHGGQNPLEAVRLGACVTIGPHHWNQAEAVAKLGLPIAKDGADLARIIGRWLDSPDQRAQEAEAQMAKARALGGAVEASLQALQPILNTAGIHV